ncbi:MULTISPECIES: LacI family DNA-binding transcriptional regulator [Rhodomicrobium]|uniref:LacI family DNA-binding transcriptional regulator n=1 Tax=Rhodomicrobium TaxID=1068 RepID=UPI001FD9C80D|nr:MULTISPECIES: LacI family DNA-binding transcriptional regulator [Rhodomicrobium]
MDDADIAWNDADGPSQEIGGGEIAGERQHGRRVTMTDVARAAGCSQSTVSVVLNNTPSIKISTETRSRVLSAIEELGYRPQKSRTAPVARSAQIAIIFDRIATSPEAVVAIDGAREAAWESGHIVCAFQTFNDAEMEPLTIQAALGNGVDAIIYATIMTRQVVIPDLLHEAEIPVVLLNCYADGHAFPVILPGEVAGGHRATNLLIASGHRRIAHITGEMWMDAGKERLKGYRHALATADIPFDPDLVRVGNWQTSAGYEQTNVLMDLPHPPTAIFCANDRMAVGCYEALKERGLAIPGDVSVIGYDDEEIARHLTPPLTTLVLPHREMGRWAVETALSLARSRAGRFRPTKLECPLIERASIAPPKRAEPALKSVSRRRSASRDRA